MLTRNDAPPKLFLPRSPEGSVQVSSKSLGRFSFIWRGVFSDLVDAFKLSVLPFAETISVLCGMKAAVFHGDAAALKAELTAAGVNI